MNTREKLATLRWSVKKSRIAALTDTIDCWIERCTPAESLSSLCIVLRIKKPGENWRTVTRPLPKAHVGTKGRTLWFTDSTWRLSEAGLDFWSTNIDEVLKHG